MIIKPTIMRCYQRVVFSVCLALEAEKRDCAMRKICYDIISKGLCSCDSKKVEFFQNAY